MAQIFHPSTNTIAKASIFGAAFFVLAAFWIVSQVVRSAYFTGVNEAVEQPVPFSHEHHVAGLGIDCRYCHVSVETAAYAGMPATKTCMTCHSQIWTNAPILEPVRASWRDDRPIQWNRVHDLPDFVQFNHGIHVQKGVGCYECHGKVDGMPLVAKANSLHMDWCLDCHRKPEAHVRPREQVFSMSAWLPPDGKDRLAAGRELVKKYNIRSMPIGGEPLDPHRNPHAHPGAGVHGRETETTPIPITNCSACHY
jgi:hypothetical protein